jgi:hypothetical protein
MPLTISHKVWLQCDSSQVYDILSKKTWYFLKIGLFLDGMIFDPFSLMLLFINFCLKFKRKEKDKKDTRYR